MKIKWYLLFSIIILATSWVSVSVFAQTVPEANEVLNCYKNSLSYEQCISMNVTVAVNEADANSPQKGHEPYKFVFVYHRNGRNMEWLGKQLFFNPHGNVDPNRSSVITRIITDEQYVDISTRGLGKMPRNARILRDYADAHFYQRGLLYNSDHAGVLFGKVCGSDYKSIAELLEMSPDLHLRSEMETINGSSCYVLEGSTKYGKVTAWIAPEKGCSTLKWTIYKGPNDIYKAQDDFYDEHEEKLLGERDSWSVVFDNVALRQIDNSWITVGGRLTYNKNYVSNGIRRDHWDWHTYTVSNVDLHPDFETMGAFKINLPNSTRVHTTLKNPQGVRYIWQDGKVVPDVNNSAFKEIDKTINNLKNQ